MCSTVNKVVKVPDDCLFRKAFWDDKLKNREKRGMVEKKMQDKCQFKKAFLGIEGEK